MSAVSTEGRVFAAQLTRDLLAREAAAADLLSPGTKRWPDALQSFCNAIAKSKGPVRAADAFKAGLGRLRLAQKDNACFINSHMIRSRSGGFELLTWEVAKHPLMDTGNEGVLVRGYHCLLQRGGCIRVNYSKLAFCTWHALARIRERSKLDLFDARSVVAGCGLVGLLMRESSKHANSGIYYATAENLLCAGVLRVAEKYAFFDMLTAFQPNEEGPQVRQWNQGLAIANTLCDYLQSKNADPAGYADKIEVLPFRSSDFISRELKRAS
jgi:hypothetical protein